MLFQAHRVPTLIRHQIRSAQVLQIQAQKSSLDSHE